MFGDLYEKIFGAPNDSHESEKKKEASTTAPEASKPLETPKVEEIKSAINDHPVQEKPSVVPNEPINPPL